MTKTRLITLSLIATSLLLLAGCQLNSDVPLPTRIPLLNGELSAGEAGGLPATWTPLPDGASHGIAFAAEVGTLRPSLTPSHTPVLPTRTPIPPTLTPSLTPTPSATVDGTITPTPKALAEYGPEEALPVEVYPRPSGDNGWGMHWIPTNKQDRAVVDRFVAELARMHIKWVVFLNDGTNIGDNDYLVERLVANGMMPVMRVYRSGILPYDGDLGPMVAHYRVRGVYYFQLYNEPNVNEENHQGVANPTQYAVSWATGARDVINNGGFPGIGALSPGGTYDHYLFLDRTLRALKFNGDDGLLNRSWLSVHNYHGLRAYDDEDGFLLFHNYDEIIRAHLHRSLPMIGTEGGSYSPDPQLEKQFLIHQYSYMREAEPYFLAFSWWLLANQEGGSWDGSWEWQSLFRAGFVHPAVGDFFYVRSR